MDEQRIEAVTEFSRDVAVDASAGTGKTATLVARVTNLFLAERSLLPDEILLLTFTDKAAGEMKSRVMEGWERLLNACRSLGSVEEVRERIAAWNPLVRVPGGDGADLADLRLRVDMMADGMGRLSVTTFHSFCARVLRAFPAEARVDPRFEVLAEGDTADAWDGGFRAFLRSEFGRAEVDPRWERVLARGPGREAVFSMIRRLVLFQRDLLLAAPPDFGAPSDLLDYLRFAHDGDAAWFREFVAGIGDPGHEMVPVLRRAGDVLARAWDAVRAGDMDAARALAGEGAEAFAFRADRTRSRKAFPRPPGATLRETRDSLKGFWAALLEAPDGDAAARFLVDRARAALAAYEAAKGSGLDFMDLLLRANALLRDHPGVAARLSRRFRYIFVDEFQDTDPAQAEMLAALSSDGAPGRLFLVGDPKQSIYAFRRADIQVYQKFRKDVLARGGAGISLARNFRSRPDLLSAVNGLFAGVFTGREDFSPVHAPVLPSREDAGPGPPVTRYTLDADAGEPEFLCGLVRAIVGNVPVGGRKGTAERPASYRDVAVLYRSDAGGETLSAYREAFAGAGIPHVVPSRRGFYTRQEVQDLRMVLAAVDAPADPAARYAALKTIFFGLGDREILALHGDAEPPSPRVRDGLALLTRLSARRGRASLPGLLAELYRESGVAFVAARLPEGERILRNLAKAAELARAFEWKGGGSLKGFAADLRRRTDEDRPENEFPSFEEGEDAVRVSTIHASKGLEFPVVILANLSRGGRKPPEGLRVDRVRGMAAVIFPGIRTYSAFRLLSLAGRPVTFERWEAEKQASEEERLLYVAATRARDRLFLVEGGRGKGSALRDALRAGIATAGDGGEGRCPLTALPGRRRVFPGGGEILDVPVRAPVARAEPARPVPPEIDLPEGWSPPIPEAVVPASGPVSLRELHDRARGTQFGEKVHRVLEAFPPAGDPWPPPAASLPVLWGEGEEERWEEIGVRMAASPFRRELRGAETIGTEIPLYAFRDGRAVEDRADLVVRLPRRGAAGGGTGEEFWVVDYKTGPREEEREAAYLLQVRNYVDLLAQAWNVRLRGFLWYVEAGETVEAT